MTSLGCFECGKNLIQNEALGLVIQNGFHQPIKFIWLSATKKHFEKFLNYDDANVSLSADVWMSFKTSETLYFHGDEDMMRSDFVEMIEDYKASFKADQWVSECQCPQCRVLQALALERAYIIKNATLEDDDIKIKVSKSVMELIYFRNHYKGVEEFEFKKHEWDTILDKWEDFKEVWKYHRFLYHCDVQHGLIDTMWSAVGIPVQVIRYVGGFQTALDIRICGKSLESVKIDNLREAVWSKIGDELMVDGWRQEELNFVEFKGRRDIPLNGYDFVDDDDDDELQALLIDNPNFELVLIDEDVEDNEDEEPVDILVRWMFEPYITRAQGEFEDDSVEAFKEHFIESNELDLEPDELRVVWRDRDLEDYECWDDLGYRGGDTFSIQVFIRGKGGGGQKRKFEEVIEDLEYKVKKTASKMPNDNPYKVELDAFFLKLRHSPSSTPFADIVNGLNIEDYTALNETYWADKQSSFERYLPNIAKYLDPLVKKIEKAERDAMDAKEAIYASLCGFFAHEFNNGREVRNSMFEKLLENRDKQIEEDLRVEARAQQLVLERQNQNAPNNGDSRMEH